MSKNQVKTKTRRCDNSIPWRPWVDRAERATHTREQAVLAYIKIGERARDYPISRKRATRRERRREEKHHRYQQPDYTEKLAQEINKMMREAISAAPQGDGLITGPLTVAARYGARYMVAEFELDRAEHEPAIEQWLVGRLGQTVRDFNLQEYVAWRAESLRKVAGV